MLKLSVDRLCVQLSSRTLFQVSDLAVVIAAYNAEHTIGRAVDSATAAGASEIVVVDDGSTDGTAVAAREAGATVIRQENAGAAAARRVGFRAVSSTLVTFLDADDALVAEGVQRSIDLHASSEISCTVGGTTLAVGAGGGERALSAWPSPINALDLIERNTSPGPPSMFVWRRTVLAQVLAESPPGLWPRYAEDYEMNIRGAMIVPIILHNTISVKYSAAGGKSAVTPLNSLKCADEIRVHYSKLLGIPARPSSSRQLKARAYMRHSWVAATEGRRGRRIGYASLSAILDPRTFSRMLLAKAFL